MVTNLRKRSVGVFANRKDAEEALQELKNSGFPMGRVSVIAKDVDSGDDIAGAEVSDKVGDKSDEGARVGAATGGALGGLTGLLVGLGTLAIPGIGPVMLAGATATAIATTLAGVGIGAVAGGLIGALIGLGIPEERAKVYHERVEKGGYLVIVDGTDEEIARAETILNRRGIEEYGIYNHPDAHSVDQDKYAVGYFNLREDAEATLNDLRSNGFALSQISLVHHDRVNGDALRGVNFSDRLDTARYALSNDLTHFYNGRINNGDYIIAVRGTDEEINLVTRTVHLHKIQEWQVFDSHNATAEPHRDSNLTENRQTPPYAVAGDRL